MSVKIYSAALTGLEAVKIDVEVDSFPGLHFFNIVGLPDKSVEESKDRLDSAIRNSGFANPKSKNLRIVVNLAPASIKKEGSLFDLPIALGYLAATNQVKLKEKPTRLFVGELSLDGSLRSVSGILPIALMAKKKGFDEVVVPKRNAQEAALVKGLRVVGAKNLKELVGYLKNEVDLEVEKEADWEEGRNSNLDFDFSSIKGQESAKRALFIAAAGGHNVLMFGPPGSGKTILAKALSGILPSMTYEEALEVTSIYSVAGLTHSGRFIKQRPFRNPHHTTSAPGVIGGGNIPHPGEISLAHRGVLFLDELPEFPRNVLESLRQPMEDGHVNVSRAAGTSRFPARFMLVGSMNPCPCGNYGSENEACACLPGNVLRYKKKISGPLLDRIDLQIYVSRETYSKLSSQKDNESSAEIKKKVEHIRGIQLNRLAKYGFLTNAEINFKNIHKICQLTPKAENLVSKFIDKNHISGRGYHRILKLGRTIADIDNKEEIREYHISEAMNFRMSDLARLA